MFVIGWHRLWLFALNMSLWYSMWSSHHNLWTMPLPVSMRKTVRRFSGREIKRKNISYHWQILINSSFDTSRDFPSSFPPCFLFESGHFITCTSLLMRLTPPDSESSVCDSLFRQTGHANRVKMFTYCPAKPVGPMHVSWTATVCQVLNHSNTAPFSLLFFFYLSLIWGI